MKHFDKVKHNIAIVNTRRAGAPYTIDGEHHFNNGDLAEITVKAALGYAPIKDANTAYNIDSDIPEICASVKSAKATLCSAKLGNDFDSVLTAFMNTVHSTCFIWAIADIDNVEFWEMNASEFVEFTKLFGYFTEDRKVIRYKTSSKAMIKWLNDRS